MKIVSLKEKTQENTQWPVNCLLKQIDDYDEVLIVAKKKNEDGYTRFSSSLKSTFWWSGALDAVKRELMDQSMVYVDGDEKE